VISESIDALLKHLARREEAMNHKILMLFVLVGILLGIPQFVLAGEVTKEQVSEWKLEAQGWSIQDHIAAAYSEEEEVQSLEDRIQHLDKRIRKLEEKPYFDPKGFTRSSLKLLSSRLEEQEKLLNEKIAWHFRQADQAKLTE
jgi:peptidoglycan hydrolase CwlO-like protein